MRIDTRDNATFLSGAALATLHAAVGRPEIPQALWRDRLALTAAAACGTLEGRRESLGDLRDAVHLLRPGDRPGPAGEIVRRWSRAAARPVSAASLRDALPDLTADRIAGYLAAGRADTPVARGAAVLEAVLTDAPQAETSALILADAAIALAMGWTFLLPILATGVTLRDLRQRGHALTRACHAASVTAAGSALRLAADLARRADRLNAAVPALRARGADRAVALFLARDALAPNALTGILSDRAARRLCHRLVDLGVLRELTGRDSFRLYGL